MVIKLIEAVLKKIYIPIFFLFLGSSIFGQKVIDSSLVQFSGMVVIEEKDQLVPLPFANVYIKETYRGTYTNLDGFFTIVGKKGDVVVFSSLGYKDVEYTIPDTITESRYTIYQIMSQDTFMLPETVVYPWPSREYFSIEFLAMDVNDVLQKQASENLSAQALGRIAEITPADGLGNSQNYFRQQANNYVYDGQLKPQNVFNPLAWAKFFKAWKRGDFKKKKDK